MNLILENEQYNHLKFSIENVKLSIVNGLRRILMSEIPSFSIDIDKVNILKNTSIFHNEYIKERLSLVPIKYFNNITTETETFNFIDVIDMNNIKCSINKKNETDDNINITTADIDIKLRTIIDDGDLYNDIKEKLFIEPPIVLIQLKPKEEFHCTLEISEGVAGKYSLLKNIKTNNARWQTCSNIGFEHENNKYKFDIETCGVYNNKTILYMGIELLIKKITNFIDNLEKIKRNEVINDLKINPSETVKNMYNIIINKENHTLGNILVELLYDNENIEFCSYKQPHPLEDIIVLQIKTDSNLIDMLVGRCNESIDIIKLLLNNINDKFIERKLL